MLIGVVLVGLQPPQQAQALTGSDFNAGYIIDDANFYNPNAMTQADIQAFLEAKEPGACGGNCLKNFTYTTQNLTPVVAQDGNKLCTPYVGVANEPASQIIYKVEQACGISAKVILVTMQKEQSLVTAMAPTPGALNEAMGYDCPDSSPVCNGAPGFGTQVYLAASQLQRYAHSSSFGKPGLRTIAYSPDPTCGSKTFVVTNYATSALYDYTPYTPNAAALANLNGTAACGSYGNRNFWVYYSEWFGGPTGNPQGALQGVTASNNSVTVSGWAVDPDVPSSALTIRVRGTGWSQEISAGGANAGSENAFPGAGTNHGFSATVLASVGAQPICVDAVNQAIGVDVTLGCVNVTVPTALTTNRIQGTDRYNTAVAVSGQTAPGVPVVYVASGENYPDALSVAPAAAKQGVPLLLVTSTSVPLPVLNELTRLGPATIVVVGGEAAISDAVVEQLSTIAPVTRISGVDRYQTSLQIGDVLGANHSGKVYLATGSNFPDALSSASSAGFLDAPLLLVDGTASTISATLSDALQQWGVTQVVVVGGTTVMTPQFQAALGTIPGVTSVTRLSGIDRYSTSVAVNAATFPHATGAFIATGTVFPDGLSGGALAGREGKPMYLVPGTCVQSDALNDLVASGPIPVTFIGGTSALTPAAAAFAPC
jgi:putative cell wall-binding protein